MKRIESVYIILGLVLAALIGSAWNSSDDSVNLAPSRTLECGDSVEQLIVRTGSGFAGEYCVKAADYVAAEFREKCLKGGFDDKVNIPMAEGLAADQALLLCGQAPALDVICNPGICNGEPFSCIDAEHQGACGFGEPVEPPEIVRRFYSRSEASGGPAVRYIEWCCSINVKRTASRIDGGSCTSCDGK